MKNGTRKKTKDATASPESPDLHVEIAKRAYEMPMAITVSALAMFLLWRHRGNFAGLLKAPADPADTPHQQIAAAASTARS